MNFFKRTVLRDPVSGRLFTIEKNPGAKAAPFTLRRLDRGMREQAHIYRTRAEVEAMEVLVPQIGASNQLPDATKALLVAWEAFVDAGLNPASDACMNLVWAFYVFGEVSEGRPVPVRAIDDLAAGMPIPAGLVVLNPTAAAEEEACPV